MGIGSGEVMSGREALRSVSETYGILLGKRSSCSTCTKDSAGTDGRVFSCSSSEK